MAFEFGCIVDVLGGDDADIFGSIVEFYELKKGFFVRMRGDEDALLEFVKFEIVEVLAKNVTKYAIFFGDVENDDAPKTVPRFLVPETNG